MITVALAALTLLFTFIRFIDKPGGGAVDRTFWAWLGLALAIVIAVGAWMNMQASGESFADIRASVAAATGGEGRRRPQRRAGRGTRAAGRGAAGRDDGRAAH